VPKNEIVAQIQHDAIMGVDGDWGDYAAIVPLLPSGSDAAAPHLTWDDKPFNKGEATFFEISGCYRRYHAPLCRTIFLGTPPDIFRAAEAALYERLLREAYQDPDMILSHAGTWESTARVTAA
ncbi:MAG: M24 family metallopeptidase, partial [Paracoccaceae bacterium]